MRADYAQWYSELYHRHFWWRAREWLVTRLIERHAPGGGQRVLDVGCGDGLFFPVLQRFGTVRGIETDVDLLDPEGPYRDRIDTRPLGDAMYAGRRHDLVVALDVLEHIEDDRAAVRDIAAMLDPGGILIVTVPAHPELWSSHDEINHHFRRYMRDRLREVLAAELEILDLRHFFHSLYPVRWLQVRAERRRPAAEHGLPSIPPAPASRTLELVLRAEAALSLRLSLPFGTSILAVARKPRRPDRT